jgi:hypothetical protein
MPLMSKPLKTKGSLVTEVFQSFGDPVFTEWLRFRRRALAALEPNWLEYPKDERRVQALDKAAAVWAKFN